MVPNYYDFGWPRSIDGDPSSQLKSVTRLQSQSRGLSIGGLVLAGPADHHKAYI